jgi:glutaryl-CoA dehydrogenase (non-decarboxylating)
MTLDLAADEATAQERFRAFTRTQIAPRAALFDRERTIPRDVLEAVAREGYWGATIPRSSGGMELTMLTLGLLHEATGAACSSLRSLLTVHHMVCSVLLRWGKRELQERLLPRLATGELLASFALSEPDVGSDATGIATQAERHGDHYLLTGKKKWITGGGVAGLFLIFARSDEGICAFLVDRDALGLSLCPLNDLLGVRASMLVEIDLRSCAVPEERLIGKPGFGFSQVANLALDLGRYCVAWGCVGIGRVCLEASLTYADHRRQFGQRLRELPLVQQLLTQMITELSASRLLCLQAGRSRDRGEPDSVVQTLIAKYHGARMVKTVADHAVQIHGGNGYRERFPVERYLRDARVMEIIEGTTQLMEQMIAKSFCGLP